MAIIPLLCVSITSNRPNIHTSDVGSFSFYFPFKQASTTASLMTLHQLSNSAHLFLIKLSPALVHVKLRQIC